MKLTATSAPLYSVDGQRALKASAAHTIADTTTLAEVEDAADRKSVV